MPFVWPGVVTVLPELWVPVNGRPDPGYFYARASGRMWVWTGLGEPRLCRLPGVEEFGMVDFFGRLVPLVTDPFPVRS